MSCRMSALWNTLGETPLYQKEVDSMVYLFQRDGVLGSFKGYGAAGFSGETDCSLI